MNRLKKLILGLGIVSGLLLAIAATNQMFIDRHINHKALDPFYINAYTRQTSLEAQFDLALAYLEQGNLPRTLEYIRRAERMGDNYKDKLINFYQKAISQNPSTHNLLGRALSLYLNGFKNESLPVLNSIAGQSTVAQALLAVHTYESGNPQLAYQNLTQLSQKHPHHHYLTLLQAIAGSKVGTLFKYFLQEPATLVFILEIKVLWGLLILALSLWFYEFLGKKSVFNPQKIPNHYLWLALAAILVTTTLPAWLKAGYDANLRWYLVHHYQGFIWLSAWDGLRTPFVNWYLDFVSRYFMGIPMVLHAMPLLIHFLNLWLGFKLIKTVFQKDSIAWLFVFFFNVYFAIPDSLIHFGGHRDPILIALIMGSLLCLTAFKKTWLSQFLYFIATMSSEGAVPMALTLGYFHSKQKGKVNFKTLSFNTFKYLIPYIVFLIAKKFIFNFNPSPKQTNFFNIFSDLVPTAFKTLSPLYKQEFSWVPSNPWPVFVTLGLLVIFYMWATQEKDFNPAQKNSWPISLAFLTLPGFLLYATLDAYARLAYFPSWAVVMALALAAFMWVKGINANWKEAAMRQKVHTATFFVMAWLCLISLSTFQETQKHYIASFLQGNIVHAAINAPGSRVQNESLLYLTNLNTFNYALVDFYAQPLASAYPKFIRAGSNMEAHYFSDQNIPDISGIMLDGISEGQLKNIIVADVDWQNATLSYHRYFRCFFRGFYYEIDLDRNAIVVKQTRRNF